MLDEVTVVFHGVVHVYVPPGHPLDASDPNGGDAMCGRYLKDEVLGDHAVSVPDEQVHEQVRPIRCSPCHDVFLQIHDRPVQSLTRMITLVNYISLLDWIK